MRFRRALLLVLAIAATVLATAPGAPCLADGGPVATPSPAPAANDTTTVVGDLPPELVARWLVLVRFRPSTITPAPSPEPGASAAALPVLALSQSPTGSGEVTMVRTWEIAKGAEEGLVLRLNRGELPEELKAKLAPARAAADRASPEGGGDAPRPDARSLSEVAQLWPSLAASGGGAKAVATRLIAIDSATDEDRARVGLAGARTLIEINEARGGRGDFLRHVSFFALTEVSRDRLAGRFSGVMILPPQTQGAFMVPPLPMALEGDIVAYRVPEVASPEGGRPTLDSPAGGVPGEGVPSQSQGETRSLLDRLLAVFSGCTAR